MPSLFPGMDPYLEGHLWPDVHHRLATEISRQLTPRLRPRYVARLDIYVSVASAITRPIADRACAAAPAGCGCAARIGAGLEHDVRRSGLRTLGRLPPRPAPAAARRGRRGMDEDHGQDRDVSVDGDKPGRAPGFCFSPNGIILGEVYLPCPRRRIWSRSRKF